MNPETPRSRPETWLAAISLLLFRVALAAAALYVLYHVGVIFVIVMIAVLVALSMAPPIAALCRWRALHWIPRHPRRLLATTVVFVGLSALAIALGVLILRPLMLEIEGFVKNWGSYQLILQDRAEWFHARYLELPADTRQWLEAQVQAWFQERGARDVGSLLATQVQHMVQRTLQSGMFLVELILIPVLAFSFLTESRPLKREFANLLPRARLRDGLYLARRSRQILQDYAIGQLILALIAGVVVYLLMNLLGINFALAMAVIAGVTRVIPVIGPIIGGIPIVLVASLQGWQQGLAVLIAFTVMHLVESKVVMPRLIGHRIDLHPAIVIIVLLVGAEFFGMWGMFLAAPAAAIVRAALHHFYVRPRGRGGRPVSRPPAPVIREEPELERPAVAGLGSHSGAH